MMAPLHPAALPSALSEPSGGIFLFLIFIGMMVIVLALVVVTFLSIGDPNHSPVVLSDEPPDGSPQSDAERTQ